MIMRMGECCKLCNIIYKDRIQALNHFIKEHPDVAMVRLAGFITSEQYMDTEEGQ